MQLTFKLYTCMGVLKSYGYKISLHCSNGFFFLQREETKEMLFLKLDKKGGLLFMNVHTLYPQQPSKRKTGEEDMS